MSIFRNVSANGMYAGKEADTLSLETTPTMGQTQQGITFIVSQEQYGDPERLVTISLADAREIAGWLIEHAVDPEAGPDLYKPDYSTVTAGRKITDSPQA